MVHVPLTFLSQWREFTSAPYLAEKKNLMTVRISQLLKSRASPDKLPFTLCNKKRLATRHVNRPLFPTTLSIPSYDIGKSVGLRTYQHPSYHVTSHIVYELPSLQRFWAKITYQFAVMPRPFLLAYKYYPYSCVATATIESIICTLLILRYQGL